MATRTTINADRYCETLTKLRRAIQNRRKGMLSKGINILHDNARPHAACQTVTLLQWFGWDIITYPPYSPDLAPSELHMFPKLKEHLSRMRFNDDDAVKDAVQCFNSMVVNWYDLGIWKVPIRLQKCINRNGNYVEKWINTQVWNDVNRIENKHVLSVLKNRRSYFWNRPSNIVSSNSVKKRYNFFYTISKSDKLFRFLLTLQYKCNFSRFCQTF